MSDTNRSQSQSWTARQLRPLVDPRSVAVIGASTDPAKFGSRILNHLGQYGFEGGVYPTNPKYDEVLGYHCYPNVASLPEPPDLTVVALPAAHALPAVEASIAAGSRSVAVLSAGWAEQTDEGRQHQERLSAMAIDAGVPVLGPNCQGMANFLSGAVVNFHSVLGAPNPKVQPGSVAIVGQSGMTGAFICHALRSRGVGVGHLVATGNQASVSVATVGGALLELPAGQGRPGLILLAMEDVGDGEDFLRMLARARNLAVPVLVLKAGTSESGARAIGSHTASIAVDHQVFQTVCAQYGAPVVHDVREMVQAAVACTTGIAKAGGTRVGIVSNSGGFAAVMADEATALGLELAAFSDATMDMVRGLLPSYLTSLGNPIDIATLVLDSRDDLRVLLTALGKDPSVDQIHLFLGLHPYDPEGTVEALSAAQVDGKPIVVTWSNVSEEIATALERAGVYRVDFPSDGLDVAALFGVVASAASRPGPGSGRRADAVVNVPALEAWQRPWVTEMETFLVRYGVPILGAAAVTSADEAVREAESAGLPVAMKVGCTRRTHKRAFGGVRTNLADVGSVMDAYESLAALTDGPGDDVLVQRMAPPDGIELLASIKRDEHFGWLLVVATGGELAGTWHDEQLVLLPCERDTVEAAVDRLACAVLLRRSPRAVQALTDSLMALATLAPGVPDDVSVFEINPLIVARDGEWAWAVDWRCDVDPSVAEVGHA